jgi:thiol-disulfide isomerase/thioredoxin
MAKPVVDGIEKDLEGQVKVIKLDVQGDVGGQAAQRYGVYSIPTLIVLDGNGQVQDKQIGIPDRKRTVEHAKSLLQ